MSDILFYFTDVYAGDNARIYQAIKNTEKIDETKLQELKNKYKEHNIKYLTLMDNIYPNNVLLGNHPPFIIFYKGNKEILTNHQKVYLVNETHNTFTQKYIQDNIEQLVKTTTLVTNGYKYTELEFIKQYKKYGGTIIHIAKCGLDKFNFENIDLNKELVISKYPINYTVQYENFKSDNYFAALLSDQLIYFSSKEKSKTHNLVNYFLDIGKEVFCFPGYGISDGNNELIKSGVKLITYIAETIQI